ncbi:hypothetical protein [Lactococcus lactis]|uniref:hypothetical protein n=1 Tax=Lactococcus lactis TaxID=1358 RepID=UPI001E64B391|nr:hypothetical protein [Lactococcus lactis]
MIINKIKVASIKKKQPNQKERKQISGKDQQIEKLTNLLDQQLLALQDKKLLEEYKTENDSLKAITGNRLQKVG